MRPSRFRSGVTDLRRARTGTFHHEQEPPRRRRLSLPQVGGPPTHSLVSLERGGLRGRARGGQAGPPRHRRGVVPLVPRDGRRVVRGSGARRLPQRATSSASRWTATSGPTWTRATSARSRRSRRRAAGRSPRFLTPAGEVFYGGHLLPARREVRTPGFRTVLGSVLEAYRDRRDQVHSQAQAIRRVVDAHLDEGAAGTGRSPRARGRRAADGAGVRSGRTAASARQPKFPHPGAVTLLLHRWWDQPTDEVAHHRRPHARRAWGAAASTTSSAADSTATAWTRSGSSRTSRRCRTTTPSCCAPTSTPTRCSAPRSMPRSPAGSCAGCGRWRRTPRVATPPVRTPTSGLDDDGDYFTWTRDEAAAVLDPEEMEVAAAYYDIGTAGEMHHNPVEERAVRRRHRARAGPEEPGAAEEAVRSLLDSARRQAQDRAGPAARAVRGPHPLHGLERDDGVGAAARRRGPGRSLGVAPRARDAGAAPAARERPTRWPTRRVASAGCWTTRCRPPPPRSTATRPPAIPPGSAGPRRSWIASGGTTGTRSAADCSTSPRAARTRPACHRRAPSRCRTRRRRRPTGSPGSSRRGCMSSPAARAGGSAERRWSRPSPGGRPSSACTPRRTCWPWTGTSVRSPTSSSSVPEGTRPRRRCTGTRWPRSCREGSCSGSRRRRPAPGRCQPRSPPCSPPRAAREPTPVPATPVVAPPRRWTSGGRRFEARVLD